MGNTISPDKFLIAVLLSLLFVAALTIVITRYKYWRQKQRTKKQFKPSYDKYIAIMDELDICYNAAGNAHTLIDQLPYAQRELTKQDLEQIMDKASELRTWLYQKRLRQKEHKN